MHKLYKNYAHPDFYALKNMHKICKNYAYSNFCINGYIFLYKFFASIWQTFYTLFASLFVWDADVNADILVTDADAGAKYFVTPIPILIFKKSSIASASVSTKISKLWAPAKIIKELLSAKSGKVNEHIRFWKKPRRFKNFEL